MRREILEAAWEVARRDGLGGLTLSLRERGTGLLATEVPF